MPRFTSPFDGAQLFYRDYVPAKTIPAYKPDEKRVGKSQPALVFIHGWPLSSLMYEHLMLPLCETYRFRCIAPDRRGFGKSDWDGTEPRTGDIDYNVFAQDTAHLLEKLDIGPFVFVASSMGPGETLLAYQRSQYIRQNCKGFVWIGASLPYPVSTPENPAAPSLEVRDSIIQGFRDSRAEYTHQALPAVFGSGPACEVPGKVLERFERIVGDADMLALERCVLIISSTNFTERLRKFNQETDIPVMCCHGDKDTGAPYEATAKLVKDIIPRTVVKMYEGAGHGVYLTHREQFLRDLLEFVDSLEGTKL